MNKKVAEPARTENLRELAGQVQKGVTWNLHVVFSEMQVHHSSCQ